MRVVTGLAAMLLIAGTASADILLDQGTQPVGSGRTVGTASDWRVFQPFLVTDNAGWNVTSVSLDGWKVTGSGTMDVTIRDVADGIILASTQITFTNTNAFFSDFVSGAVNVVLAGNTQYVVQAEALNIPADWNAIYLGTSGLPSFSRNSSGQEFGAGPIAMILEGKVAPAPGAASLLALAGLAAARRRR